MAAPRESLYDALGVSPDARPIDIVRAYEQLVAEFRKDTTPPDPRREARIREAYNVLSDAQRRAEYDRLLQAPPPPPAFDRRKAWVLGGIAAAIVVAAGYFAFGRSRGAREARAQRGGDPGRPRALPRAACRASTSRERPRPRASPSRSRTGSWRPRARGSLPARRSWSRSARVRCPPGSRRPTRRSGCASSRSTAREAGPCPRAARSRSPGTRSTRRASASAGEVVLVEGKVKRVFAEAQARFVEAAVPVAAGMGGRPLLDLQGRVVAVATASQPGGDARHVAIPGGLGRPVRPATGEVRAGAPAARFNCSGRPLPGAGLRAYDLVARRLTDINLTVTATTRFLAESSSIDLLKGLEPRLAQMDRRELAEGLAPVLARLQERLPDAERARGGRVRVRVLPPALLQRPLRGRARACARPAGAVDPGRRRGARAPGLERLRPARGRHGGRGRGHRLPGARACPRRRGSAIPPPRPPRGTTSASLSGSPATTRWRCSAIAGPSPPSNRCPAPSTSGTRRATTSPSACT